MRDTSSALLIAILALGVLAASTASAEETLSATLHRLAKDHAAAYDREDLEALLGQIHTNSPEYEKTQELLASQFRDHELKTEIVSFQYIGHDDEFAYARVKLKTSNSGEAGFSDNTVDTITLFHREDGAWKYWSDFILGVELLEGS